MKVLELKSLYGFHLLGRLDPREIMLWQETDVKWFTLSKSCFLLQELR